MSSTTQTAKYAHYRKTYLSSSKAKFFNKSLTTKMYTTTIRNKLCPALSLPILSFNSMR